ncbi:SPOR domain-containing protein [Chitinimonas koreensis]|uniref:SPOR domain-containing protein n=1 Tax=Chitinimonas koreensis TaxID=356302 RepID=UPI00041FAA62|nr:SPOR domain-containing protein [Chitinimonas koreensis]QNM94969.1 SPOR domain-containing protein [Chitinimonas koreensis]
MADAPISEELTALKKRARRRLVGAIALVLAALVVLWTVMDDKPPQSLVTQPVAIVSNTPALSGTVHPVPAVEAVPPAAPSSQPAPTLAPQVVPTKPTPVPTPLPTPTPRPELRPEPAKPAEKPSETRPTEPKRDPARILAGAEEPAHTAAKPTEKPVPQADDKPAGKFYLQIGAFADKSKADALIAKARGAGVGLQSETVRTDKGELTRLRAGPYASRELADKAHERLAGVGVTSSVIGK